MIVTFNIMIYYINSETIFGAPDLLPLDDLIEKLFKPKWNSNFDSNQRKASGNLRYARRYLDTL